MPHDSSVTKKLFIRMLCFGVAFSLLHIVLERSMAFVGSDVALMDILPLLDLAIVLCDAVFFFVEYALLASALFRFSPRMVPGTLLLPVAICLFKHFGNWWAFLITEHVTDAINLRLSALTAVGSIVIEMVQYGAVLAVLLGFKKRPERTRALLVCGVLLAVNLLSRIIGDIEYGAPTSAAEVGVMMAYYAFDIALYGPAAFLFMRRLIGTTKEPTE